MTATPTLFVTGATGQLGQLVIDTLLETVPAESIIAGVRDPNSEAALALRSKGVVQRVADYARPETLENAFHGVDRLLLISGSEVGRRKVQHRAVVAAAKSAGVGLIAYTSILRADTSPLLLAEEHRDTEAAIKNAGVPFVLLRNGWYTEVYTWRVPLAVKQGVLIGAAADGRISAAARADYAKAAAVVLTGDGHAGRTYELAGDNAFTLSNLADAITDASNRSIAYRDMSADDFRAAAIEAGVPENFAMILSDTDAGVAKGALVDDGHALRKLIGRPTTPFRATIADFVRHQFSPQIVGQS